MKMCQDWWITTEAKIDRKWVIQESNEHEFILFMVEENLDLQLAEEKTSLITYLVVVLPVCMAKLLILWLKNKKRSGL